VAVAVLDTQRFTAGGNAVLEDQYFVVSGRVDRTCRHAVTAGAGTTTPAAYRVVRTFAAAPSLTYAVRAPAAASKTARYTVPAPASRARAAAYGVRTTPGAVTGPAAYRVRATPGGLTRGAEYAVVPRVSVDRSLAATLAVRAPAGLARAAGYAVVGEGAVAHATVVVGPEGFDLAPWREASAAAVAPETHTLEVT
jgi:hypothetical protein